MSPLHKPLAALAAILALVLAAAAIALPSLAHSYKLGDIAVGHVWSPPPEPGADGIPVYGPVLNQGSAPVRLVGVTSPIANAVRFRRSKEGDVRWPDVIQFLPGRPFALAPWREHIWLTGLKRPLAAGDSFDLTLDFGEAGTLTVRVVVEPTSGH